VTQVASQPQRRGVFMARVVRNDPLCTDHFRLVLRMPFFPASSPGQFVQIACRTEDATPCEIVSYEAREWTPGMPLHDPDFSSAQAYLRRPFSIAGRRTAPDGSAQVDVIHRVAGKGTRWMAGLKTGDAVSILGPLGGRSFWIPKELELALLVGGGVGIPPMFYLAEALHAAGKRAVGFVGAQRKDLVPLTLRADGAGDEFNRYGYATVIATDDGSLGMRGFVTAALRQYVLNELKNKDLRNVAVYCCGPTVMMKATARLCLELGLTCLVSLEQPMACGMGTCQSCVVKWRPAETSGDWIYKLTCTDGPVFDTRELAW